VGGDRTAIISLILGMGLPTTANYIVVATLMAPVVVSLAAQGGLHFLIPVVILVWCLMIERLSPGLSAFWAVISLVVILITQRPLTSLLRPRGGFGDLSLGVQFRAGLADLMGGLVSGARNITAIISLILGMGLPTTANYIVVATLMAPVVVSLAAQGGLMVPLIAVHLFVFYFGLMADVTPPVGLATFAAAAVSGADPIRTGIQAFFYSARTIALPFIFLFNTQLLMIAIGDALHLVITILSALTAMLVFAAATMGWFLIRSRIWETLALLLVAFILFRPGFFWDMAFPPFEARPAMEVHKVAADLPKGEFLRLTAAGQKATGEPERRAVVLPMGPPGRGVRRLASAGLTLVAAGREIRIGAVAFGSAAEKVGLKSGWVIKSVSVRAGRPDKEWMFIPALMLLVGVGALQRRRQKRSG
jgi:TRAP-type uncharacterized transport system fused permease subunit